jgi:predicted nucleic acid-binding protein
LSTSAPQREPAICNTTPVRYFALVGRFDLLVRVLGGEVHVPRIVLDPDEETDAVPASLLSEIGQSERYWAARASGSEALEDWSRLRMLRQRTDIEIVDLDDEELNSFAHVSGRAFALEIGLAAPLGRGEAAVIAIAESRGWRAILDDAGARNALKHRNPAAQVQTTVDLLRAAAAQGLLLTADAETVYAEMRAKGYRGPDRLWS